MNSDLINRILNTFDRLRPGEGTRVYLHKSDVVTVQWEQVGGLDTSAVGLDADLEPRRMTVKDLPSEIVKMRKPGLRHTITVETGGPQRIVYQSKNSRLFFVLVQCQRNKNRISESASALIWGIQA